MTTQTTYIIFDPLWGDYEPRMMSQMTDMEMMVYCTREDL